MMRRLLIGCACVTATAVGVCCLSGVPAARGDTLQMKDGTSLSGRVMDAGSNYWVKGGDGQTHTVAKDTVKQWVHGDAAPAAAAAAPTDAAGTSAASQAGRGQAASLPGSGSFKAVKAKADRVDTPMQAVALWQSFIDNKPPAADAAAAKTELAYWTQLVNGNAERVNGRWIWGPDRDKLLDQVRELLKQATKDLDSNQTINGIHELERAVKMYPNDFDANFLLGYYNLSQGWSTNNNAKMEAGTKAMETAVHLRPNSAAALSDLSIAYYGKRRYVQAVETGYRAAKIEDSQGVVQNLVNTIALAPAGMRNNAHVRQIAEETTTLARKYGIGLEGPGPWKWLLPKESDPERKDADKDGKHDDSEEKGPAGIMGNGTGEIVSADGYILTNRHVAKEGDYLMVRLSDGTLKVADRIVIDDEQDMAIIKIRTTDPLPFVRLASYDHPPVGADVSVFGFPLLGMVSSINSSVKMTHGYVSAWDSDRPMCDVTVDANVNPGNSGGPMVDHYGNLLALTTAKTRAGNIEGEASISSYGLGQSTGRIRKFLTKQAGKLTGLKLVPGTTDKVLTNEELAARLTPITVVVFMCRGTVPASDAAAAAGADAPPAAAVTADGKAPQGRRGVKPAAAH